MHKCFDVESQRWAHSRNIFIIKFFQYSSLSGIVKAATQVSFGLEGYPLMLTTYRNNSLISFSFRRFFRIIVSSPMSSWERDDSIQVRPGCDRRLKFLTLVRCRDPIVLLILQFTLYHHRVKVMAPKNKGKKAKNADDDAFWCVMRSTLILMV